MRRLKVTVCIVFVLSCALFVAYNVRERMIEDHTAPVITSDEDTVSVSVNDDADAQEKALLKGLKAEDNRDGDLTDSIRVASMSHFIGDGKRTVSYVVFDKSNQVGTYERTVQYTDYVPPKIHVTQPLRFSLEDVNKGTTVISDGMTAEDCLDGDLTGQIRTIWGDGYYGSTAGTYPMTLQVNNSAGDVCTVLVDVDIVDDTDRTERDKEYPLLSEYVVYTQPGTALDPASYLKGLDRNGSEYTFDQDGDLLEGVREAISVSGTVDYNTPGTYTVEFAYTAEGGETAVTRMYIVVQGDTGTADNDQTDEAESAETEQDEGTAQEGEKDGE